MQEDKTLQNALNALRHISSPIHIPVCVCVRVCVYQPTLVMAGIKQLISIQISLQHDILTAYYMLIGQQRCAKSFA